MNIYTAFAVHISIIPTVYGALKRVLLLPFLCGVQPLRPYCSILAVRLFNLSGQGVQFFAEYSSEKSELKITTNTVLEVTTAVEQSEEFDISYWISYAQNYAQSIGLTLDETATECWDNPISANANNKNIGADIESRLNRYKNVDGFTSVWIWAEKVSDTQYELYIGYA